MDNAPQIPRLTDQQLSALTGAGIWYAKYHAHTIAERADDRSAYAVSQRERYGDLIDGLRALGVKLPDPRLEPQAPHGVVSEAKVAAGR